MESTVKNTGGSYQVTANLQATSAINITKSDSLTYSPSTLFIGTAGDVTVITVKGESALFKNLANGSILPVLVTKVMSAGTSASDFVILS